MYGTLVTVYHPAVTQKDGSPGFWSAMFQNQPSREQVAKVLEAEHQKGNLTSSVTARFLERIDEGDYEERQIRLILS